MVTVQAPTIGKGSLRERGDGGYESKFVSKGML